MSSTNNVINRRQWLTLIPAGMALSATGRMTFADDKPAAPPRDKPALYPQFPAQPPELVQAVVGASHSNIDKVRGLIDARPALARASWDWGFGDWESALGAASHMGRADIAALLVEHGARPNLFTLAMLGHLSVVKATIEAMPGIQRTRGPHGITLLNHVRAAQWHDTNSDEHKDRAREVEKYLESLGDADTGQKTLDLTDADKQRYLGKYTYGNSADAVAEVAIHRRGFLTITFGPDGTTRNLNRVEDHGFNPSGVESVFIRFTIKNDRAIAVTIHDPEPVLTAKRV